MKQLFTNQNDAFRRKDGAEWDSAVFGKMIPDYFNQKDKALQLRSVLYWPEKICRTTQLLIMHGSADWRTALGINLQLVQKLTELKQPLRFVLYEGAVQGLTGVGQSRDTMSWQWYDNM